MLTIIKNHKNETINAGGIGLYRLFVGAAIAFYIVIIVTFVLLAATTTNASETTNKDVKIIKEYVRKTYGKGYKTKIARAESVPDRILEHRKNKKVVFVDKYYTISCGKYGKVTTKGPFHNAKINYAKSIKKGKKVVVYLIYNPFSNSTDSIDAIVNNGHIK